MHPVNLKKDWIRNNTYEAINRACQLIEEMGAGEVVGGMVDVYSKRKKEPVRVPFDADKINALSEQTSRKKI